jgi:hypothetical protein
MTLFALTSTARFEIIEAAGVVLWLALAAMVAGYAHGKGYPFFPLFVCSLLPVPGWPLVLFVVTIAAGPRPPRSERPSYEEMPTLPRSTRGPT